MIILTFNFFAPNDLSGDIDLWFLALPWNVSLSGPTCMYFYKNHYKMKHSHQIKSLDVLHCCIGCYGYIPDEYQPDKDEKKLFQPNLTISITMASAKLQDSGFSTFRELNRKSLHKISELTVHCVDRIVTTCSFYITPVTFLGSVSFSIFVWGLINMAIFWRVSYFSFNLIHTKSNLLGMASKSHTFE